MAFIDFYINPTGLKRHENKMYLSAKEQFKGLLYNDKLALH